MKNQIILCATLLITVVAGIVYSCGREQKSAENKAAFSGKDDHSQFLGDKACMSCHSNEFNKWKGSHHDYSMTVADSSTVRGDFSNTTLSQGEESYRFFRKSDKYLVEVSESGGETKVYEITHTFGWTPLQQYLVDYGRGKMQVLSVAWNTEENHWFSINPEEKVRTGNWLHWKGGAMNYNTMCANCHSTQLKENYIPAADSFNTTWTSINVSCESCHGPGKQHVDFMQSEESEGAQSKRIREDLKLTENASQIEQINTCARCHSLREKLVDYYDHEKSFMDHFNPSLPHPEMYFPDGQIKEEVYVYGSFLQSKMFEKGVKCNDCHDPHSLKLKANVTDNSLCMQCHEPRYNSQEHHFHKLNTEASQCVNCHMTGRNYMEIDFRRDHSFRLPRPDLSAKFGTPNACNGCHENKSPEWAAQTVERWYGSERPSHFSEVLLKADSLGTGAISDLTELVADTTQPDIARATAIWYLGQFPTEKGLDLLKQSIREQNPLIRKSSARAIASFPLDQSRSALADILDDSVRAVRIAAAEVLAELSIADILPSAKEAFKTAIKEYKEYLDVNQYFPNGLFNKGQFHEKRGETQKAIQAYRQALNKDPQFNPARLNLAYLYNEQGNKRQAQSLLEEVIRLEPAYGPAYYSLALLLAERGQLKAAIPKFEKAAELMPSHARVRYNLAIAFQTLDNPNAAEERYLQAIKISPENPDYRYGISTLYIQQNEYEKALPHARKLINLQPGNKQYESILQLVEKRTGN